MTDIADVDPATTARARGAHPGRRATSRTWAGGVVPSVARRPVGGRPAAVGCAARLPGARHGS